MTLAQLCSNPNDEKTNFYNFQMKWPILRQLSKYDLAKETMIGIIDIINPYVEAHQSSLNPDDIRDFLDLMLVETKNRYSSLIRSLIRFYYNILSFLDHSFFLFIFGFGRLLLSFHGDQWYHLRKALCYINNYLFNIIMSQF